MSSQSGHLQDEIANLTEEDRNIDFASVTLYIPGIQAVLTTVATSAATVLVCALSPSGTASSVRTLVCMIVVACVGVRRPLQLRQPARGMRTVFSALRPGPLLYALCLVVEQLTHSCTTNDISDSARYYRGLLFHACAVLAAAAGFYRSTRPRSEADNALRTTLAAGIAIALLPPAPSGSSGPLCLPPSVFESIERVLRSFAFASLYTAMVYASAPISNTAVDSTLCVLRCFAASVWTLAVHWTLLFISPAQLLLLIWAALQPSALHYASLSSPDGRRPEEDDAITAVEAGVGVPLCEPHGRPSYSHSAACGASEQCCSTIPSSRSGTCLSHAVRTGSSGLSRMFAVETGKRPEARTGMELLLRDEKDDCKQKAGQGFASYMQKPSLRGQGGQGGQALHHSSFAHSATERDSDFACRVEKASRAGTDFSTL